MKKNMQRIMSMMLVLLLLIPSLVIAQTNIDIDYTQDGNNVTVNIKGVKNRPASITIKDESRYYYIDQGITDDLGKVKFKTVLDVDKTYDCQVNINGEIATKKIVMKKSDIGTDPVPEPTKSGVANLYIKGYKGVILDKSNIKIEEGDTVLSVTTKILDKNNINYENRSGYIASIDGQKEFDKGRDSGWMYSVNGKYPDVGAGSVKVKDGDKISWLYTYDLGEDIGAPIHDPKDDKDDQKDAIDQILDTISDKKATEKQKEKAVDDVTKYFADKTKDVKSGEIENIIKYSNKTSKTLTNALENVETEKLAIKIADSSIEITKSLGKIVDDNTDLQTIEKISETSRENMGIALASIEKIKDKKEVSKIVNSILETSTKIEEKQSKKTAKPNKKTEKTVAIKVVEKEDKTSDFTLPNVLLEKANKKDIDKVKLVTDKATIDLSPKFLESDMSEDIKTDIKSENDILSLRFKIGCKEQNQFQKAIKITLPYNKEVKDSDKITAIVIKDDGTEEAVGGVYDPTTKSVKFITNITGKFKIEEGKKEFKDTTNITWAKDEIESMAVKGIIKGKPGDKFDPNANISRAEFAALASRILKLNENVSTKSPFKDVSKGAWYYNEVVAAYEKGIIKGRPGQIFDPTGEITREEIVKIVGTILKENGYGNNDKTNLNKLKDSSSISSWAIEEAAIAVNSGVIKGNGNGNFAPKAKATRAETATMLYRLYELILR